MEEIFLLGFIAFFEIAAISSITLNDCKKTAREDTMFLNSMTEKAPFNPSRKVLTYLKEKVLLLLKHSNLDDNKNVYEYNERNQGRNEDKKNHKDKEADHA